MQICSSFGGSVVKLLPRVPKFGSGMVGKDLIFILIVSSIGQMTSVCCNIKILKTLM